MPLIYQCECISPNYPPIEPIDAPLPFRSVGEFETWLRRRYIPRTCEMQLVDLPNTDFLIDVKKTECWGIFKTENEFVRCCQVYPVTDLSMAPDFENSLRGKIFSHNHFSDSTLSCSEVLLWANLRMKEFRAVTENCTYLIKPTDLDWPDPELLLSRINAICPSIITNSSPELRHQCYKSLAEEGWFEYIWIDTPGV
jgi:hypothetical protein